MNLITLPISLPILLLAGPVAIADHSGRAHPENDLLARPAVVVKVGVSSADIIGSDNRALQAAVDYVGNLGGGVVEIGPGEYRMRDSLHLRSRVTVRGAGAKTVLKKDKSHYSRLALDGDFGEEAITVQNPEGFAVGRGVYVGSKSMSGFHGICATILNSGSNYFTLSRPLNADCMVEAEAFAATVYPVVSGYDVEGVRLENLTVDGNREENPTKTDGCRTAGIFLYRGDNTVITNCVVRGFNGDGISFQQSNDVRVEGCVSEDNAGLGLHPGSGSQRPVIRGCIARRNGEDGLFLCWRVRHGLFEKNLLENNGRFGISIGHKDTDNLLQDNQVRSNQQDGVFFRNETVGMAGHRNRLENNLIENNGLKGEAAGIRVRGETEGLVFRNNIIRDSRPPATRQQTVGIRIEEKAGEIVLEGNQIEARTQVEDRRNTKP